MSRLAETIFNCEHVVLGKRLLPLTYFHAFALSVFGSSFAGGDGGGTLSDLALSVKICSSPRAEIEAFSTEKLSVFSQIGNLIDSIRFGGKIESERAKFYAYIKDFNCPPLRADSRGTPCKSEWPLPEIARLMHHGGMSLDAAWNTNPGFAAHLIPALQEAAGHEVSNIGEAEERAMKEAGYVIG